MTPDQFHSAGIFVFFAAVSFVLVAVKAFQQLNVVHDRKRWVFPTSGLLAIMEVTLWINVVQRGFWAWVPMFIGSGSGCLLAMWLHKRLRK